MIPGTRQLGDKMKDVVTGFEGIATGYVRYLTGCHQFLLAPKVKKDGNFMESQWFDESRLTVVAPNEVSLPKVGKADEDKGFPEPPGADQPAPKHQ